jgi:hypothetical protein
MKFAAGTLVQTVFYCASVLLTLAAPAFAQTCVPGTRASNPNSAFIIDAVNGTVTDTRTGLMWDRCVRAQTGVNCAGGTFSSQTWQQALDTAAASNTANYKGYADWRLPNAKELRSLVEECKAYPSINETAFPGLSAANLVWSGSATASDASAAWMLLIDDGRLYVQSRSLDRFVLLVRTAQ